MIIATVNQKGGSGKTTTCLNLAGIFSERGKVAVLDTDPQGSLSKVYGMRTKPFPVEVFQDPEFSEGHPALTNPMTLIDTPPGHEGHTWKALGVADLVLVPITPSVMDLLAALPLVEMAKTIRKEHRRLVVLGVMNQVKAGTNIPGMIADMARDRGLRLAKTTIPDTVGLRDATLYGLPLNYHAPRHPAAEAFRALHREIMEAIRHGK
jgi:chromosome partitioning protein